MELKNQLEVISILLMWLVPHILFLKLVWSPESKATLAFCILLLVAVYLFKPATSDLPRYSIYFSSGFLTNSHYLVNDDGSITINPIDATGEPYQQAFSPGKGFSILGKALGTSFPKGPVLPRFAPFNNVYISDFPILTIAIAGFLMLLYSCHRLMCTSAGDSKFRAEKTLVYILIILGSLFFLLGSQNAIRQFLGTSLVLLSFSFLVNKRFLFSIVAMGIAISMHHWMIGFGMYFILLWLLLELFKKQNDTVSVVFGGLRSVIVGLSIGCMGVILIKSVYLSGDYELFGYIYHNLFFLTEIKQYGLMDYSLSTNRTGALVKMLLIGLVLAVSEIVMGSQIKPKVFDIRKMRVATYCFAIPLAIYPELLSRFLLFYFAIEMLYMCWGTVVANKRSRLAIGIVFISYGFALNAINILVGTEWIQSLFV